ncbi:MAG: ABC transporter ATP-binding protein [Pseudomonadota bacterium]
MSNTMIEAHKLSRRYGSVRAVDRVDLNIPGGTIVGLVGPNGAGKTTLLRALLGLGSYEGQLSVLGRDPARARSDLMEDVCFIADTATLPRWMRVRHLLEFTAGVHPRFDRGHAEQMLASTEVSLDRRIRELSKGMLVQLHLSIVMAVDARLLVLDEPTLGLDILFRKRFYEQLLNDYFDGERTIIISTHQVEEVEHILTDVLFMDRGRIVLNQSIESLQSEFVELHALGDAVARAQSIPAVGSRSILGGRAFIYQGINPDLLVGLGELRAPSMADLFVAVIEGGLHHD